MTLGLDILALAEEPSSEKRRILLRQITDLFLLDETEHSAAETALFEEIVIRVMRDVDVDSRAELSERLADYQNAPRELMLGLAQDEIAVSGPVLERSTVLNEQDVASLAGKLGDAHLQAISRRGSISELVTDILIGRGSQLVARSVASNAGAKFSQFGFGELVKRSAGDEILQFGLAGRADLPPEVVEKLAPILSEKIKLMLVDKGFAAAGSLSGPMLDALRSRMVAAVGDRSRENREIETIIADLKAGRTDINVEMPPLADADRAYDIATIVCALTNADHAIVMKALTGRVDEPLIVLFRIIGASWDTFEDVLRLRARRQRVNYLRTPLLMRTYQQMAPADAQRILRFLQVRRVAEAPTAAAS